MPPRKMELTLMLETRQEGDVFVCDISGRLDAISADSFAEELLGELAGAGPSVLLNLSGLEYISSMGLRVFVKAVKAVNAAKGTLKVCSPTVAVLRVLEISALDTLLDLRDDEASALASF